MSKTNTSATPETNSVLELTQELVSIPSPFPEESSVATYIEKFLQNLGFSVERVPVDTNRDNLVATFGTSSEYVCFYGHMDTVPPHPDWQQNPLTVTVDDQNVAHGLGVADMKGGIAAILRVAEFAVENNYPLKLAFGVDEENISLGSHVLVQTDFFEDVVFLISAESGQVLNETQDFAINYGRKGRFVIAAEILGRQAHAARSDQAVNAITEAARLLLLIDQLQFPRHQFLENTQVIPFACESRTSAFDIPGSAHLELNILSVPGTTSENTIAQLEQLCHENGISAKFQLAERPTPYMEAYEIDRHHPLVIALEEEVFAHYNTIPAYGTSVADENRFATALRIPVISLGPVGGGDHTEHEWVRVESLGKTLSVYQDIVRFFAQRA